MKASELQEKSVSELTTELEGLLKQQFEDRMAHAGGTLEQPFTLRQVRRDIARVRTVINQKKREGEAS